MLKNLINNKLKLILYISFIVFILDIFFWNLHISNIIYSFDWGMIPLSRDILALIALSAVILAVDFNSFSNFISLIFSIKETNLKKELYFILLLLLFLFLVWVTFLVSYDAINVVYQMVAFSLLSMLSLISVVFIIKDYGKDKRLKFFILGIVAILVSFTLYPTIVDIVRRVLHNIPFQLDPSSFLQSSMLIIEAPFLFRATKRKRFSVLGLFLIKHFQDFYLAPKYFYKVYPDNIRLLILLLYIILLLAVLAKTANNKVKNTKSLRFGTFISNVFLFFFLLFPAFLSRMLFEISEVLSSPFWWGIENIKWLLEIYAWIISYGLLLISIAWFIRIFVISLCKGRRNIYRIFLVIIIFIMYYILFGIFFTYVTRKITCNYIKRDIRVLDRMNVGKVPLWPIEKSSLYPIIWFDSRLFFVKTGDRRLFLKSYSKYKEMGLEENAVLMLKLWIGTSYCSMPSKIKISDFD